MPAVFSPIAFRRVRLTDILVKDTLVIDHSIEDASARIEPGHFESGNYFALTMDGAYVYANEKICRNMNCLFYVITERDLDKALAYHQEITSKVKQGIEALREIYEATGTAILELENKLANP